MIKDGERVEGNTARTSTLITLAAAGAATFNSADQNNENGRGVHVIVDITVATTTSVTFKIQGKDPVSAAYYDLLTSAALTGTGTTLLTVYPGLTAATNTVVSQVLPKTWRVNAVVTGASSALTATVGANVIV